jgi:hypothetical protein
VLLPSGDEQLHRHADQADLVKRLLAAGVLGVATQR